MTSTRFIPPASLKKLLRISICIGAALLLNACSTIYNVTGMAIVKYGKDQMVPYFLSTDDPMVGCAMGESLSPILQSFGSVTDEMTPIIGLASGMCADIQAKEAELRYLRALKANNPIEAQDARTQQKRYMALSAKRMMQGYDALSRIYGKPGYKCPRLKDTNAELFWMLGLMDGILAVLADIGSNSSNNISLSTIPDVIKGTQCLDSDKWWGLPEGMQSLVQILMPAELPPGVDPYSNLQHSVAIGKRQGVRLTQMLEASLYANNGDTERLKAVIRDHVETTKNTPAAPSLRFLDAIATMQIRMLSDRLWTENTGQRTPFGKLGTFWDDPKAIDSAPDIDDFL